MITVLRSLSLLAMIAILVAVRIVLGLGPFVLLFDHDDDRTNYL
jgi:hypothetical protein